MMLEKHVSELRIVLSSRMCNLLCHHEDRTNRWLIVKAVYSFTLEVEEKHVSLVFAK